MGARIRRGLSRWVFVLGLSAVTGCGAVTSHPANGSTAPKPRSLTPVTLRLDFLMNGYDAPYTLAKAKGFYRQAGLAVTIHQGKGSAITAQTVANGSDTFGVADAGTVAQLISKGVPDVVLADYLQEAPLSFVYKRGVIFTSPEDLIGKTLISAPGDADVVMLPAVLARYHMQIKQLHMELVQPAAEVPAFLKAKQDILLTFSTGGFLRALKVDPQVIDKPYSDFGVNLYSIGLITSRAEIRQHPDVVRAFVVATTHGWQYAMQHPKQAIASDLAAYPKAGNWIQTQSLKLTLQRLHTPATAGRVVGWMAASDWRSMLATLHRYAGVKTIKPLADYYTDAYLPSGSTS